MKTCCVVFAGMLFLFVSVDAQWIGPSGTEGKSVQANVLSDDANGTIVEFQVPGYFLRSVEIGSDRYSSITIPGASLFSEKGFPELPRICKSIIIPDDANMQIEIVQAQYDTTSALPVLPSKGSLPDSIDPAKIAYTFDEVYQKDIFYPQELITLSDPFILRDFRGTTIDFHPFRANAVKQQLIVCKRLVVRVFPNGFSNTNVKMRRWSGISREFVSIYEDIFLNYSSKQSSFQKGATLPSDAGKILIITANDYYNNLLPFRDWKRRKGYSVDLIKCSDIASPPGPTRDQVKAYIQNVYNSPGSVTYILLVGR